MLPSLCFLSFFSIPYEKSESCFKNALKTPIRLSSDDKYDKIIDDYLANNYTSDNQQNPSIYALSNTTIAVAWESYGQDGNEYGVYAKVFNAITGVNLTQEFQINYETNNYQQATSICALTKDTFAVAWDRYIQDGSVYGVYGRVFNATTGSNITSEFLVNSYLNNDQLNPSICALTKDLILITWNGEGTTDSNGIYARFFKANTGKPSGAQFLVNKYTDNSQQNPSVSTLAENKIVFSWAGDLQDGDSYVVYARTLNLSASVPLSSEFIVNKYTNGYQTNPSTFTLSNDKFGVAFYGNGPADPSAYGVFVTLFGPATSSGGTPNDGNGDNLPGGIPGFYIEIITASLCIGIICLIWYFRKNMI